MGKKSEKKKGAEAEAKLQGGQSPEESTLARSVAMGRDIKRVSYDGKRVEIRWEVDRLEGLDEYQMSCVDQPAKELKKALNALREHVSEICLLGLEYCEDLEIRGASFSYGGDNRVMGATITALKKLPTANAPLVLNTPHLPSEPYTEQETGEELLLSAEAVDALHELQVQTLRYLDGYREQADLFTGKEPERPKSEPEPSSP